MSLAGRTTAGLLLLGLAGCRIALNHDPTGWTLPINQLAVERVEWWRDLVRPPFLEYMPTEYAAPAVDEGGELVVALTRDGKVHALQAGGDEAWTVDVRNRFSAGALIHEGVVYVPGGDGILYALDARTGKERWRYAAGEELVSVPTVAGRLVLVASQTDTLFAVNREDGRWVWQYRRELASNFSIRGASGATAQGDTAFAGFSDGHVVALSLSDGQVKWDQPLSPGGQFGDVDTTPLLENGRLFVASYREGLFELRADTGAIRWQGKTFGITHLVKRGGILYATGADRVEAHLAANGNLLWALPLKDHAAQQAAVTPPYLTVPTGGELLFVDIATGKRLMEWDPGQGVTAPATANNGSLYVLSNAGVLYALNVVQ